MKSRYGFTLIEIVVVIAITGILAAVIAVFIGPAVNSFVDVRRRADLTDMADTALRRMSQDIRSAVPNSLIAHNEQCIQFVPTIAGGRYRMAADTINDVGLPCTPGANCSAPLDTTQETTVFDVLSPLTQTPAKGDWIVIGNQNTADVYSGINRAQITATPTVPRTSDGLLRISVAATQFPYGYDGGRFVVVADKQQSVFYKCAGGQLQRIVANFSAGASTCAATGDVVASNVASCSFVFDPNQGATQQSGFVWMEIKLKRDDESITLSHGIHVDNAP